MTHSPVITRKVEFHSEDLGKDVTLIFLFDVYDETKHDAPITSHPVVWKKAFFGKTGNYSKTLEYTNQLTLTKPDAGDLKFHFPASGLMASVPVNLASNSILTSNLWPLAIPASTWSPFTLGRSLFLRRTEDGKDFKLAATENAVGEHGSPLPSDGLVLRNESGERVDAVLGFREQPGGLPQFARVFRNIGDGRPVNVTGFKPVLRAYVTSTYEEGEVLLEPTSGQLIWSENLDALSEKTQWKVSYDHASGKFIVGQTA